MSGARLMLVYDDECDFCVDLARWVARHDLRGALFTAPSRQEGLIEQLGLTRGEVARASWAVEPGGRKRWRDAAAGVTRWLR